MTKLPPAISQFLRQLEKQTALKIGEEETGEADVPMEAVIEAMVKGNFFYDPKKKGFYQRPDYEQLESSAVEVSRQDIVYFVADYLEDYYEEAIPEAKEERKKEEEREEEKKEIKEEEPEEIEIGKGEIKLEIPAGELAAREAAAPLKGLVDEGMADEPAAPAQEAIREETQEETEPEEPFEEFPASDTDPHFRLPESFVRDSEQEKCISGEFEASPSGTQQREQREVTIIAMPPPPPAEKEKRKRWEAKRSKLAFGLQNDDLSVGEKSFMSYLAYLEENPKLSLPGKGDEPARKEYIAHFFQGAVAIRGKKAAIDYLDALEAIIIEAGEETAGYFAGLAPYLYCRLPSEKANEYTAKGMRITDPADRLAYFQRESREAQDILAALVDDELARVNREYASARAKLKEAREKHYKAEAEAGKRYSQLEEKMNAASTELIELNNAYIRQTAELKEEKGKVNDLTEKITLNESAIAGLTSEAEEKKREWGKGAERFRKNIKWKVLGAAAAAFLAGAAAYAYFEDKIDYPIDLSSRYSEAENISPPSF